MTAKPKREKPKPLNPSAAAKKKAPIKTTKEVADAVWASKKGKGRTLTGKPAAEIFIKPHLALAGKDGKAFKQNGENKPKKAVNESYTAVVALGRMNPPTIGHEKLVLEAARIANEVEGVPLLILSETHNIKNPLTHTEKLELVDEAFGDHIHIVENTFSNIIEMLYVLSENYDNLIWVTGEDQLEDYNRILRDYNGKDFTFEQCTVVSVGKRDPSSSIVLEAVNASALRLAVQLNDLQAFTEGLPTKIKDRANTIFEQVKFGLDLYSKEPKTLSESMLKQIALKRYEIE